MSKRIIGAFLAILFILAALTGCGAGSGTGSAPGAKSSAANARADGLSVEPVTVETTAGALHVEFSEDSGQAETQAATEAPVAGGGSADSFVGGVDLSTEANNAILNERKMIRSANVTVEVENFDEAYSKINTIILGIGFIQETNINTEKVTVDNEQKLVKNGTIVLRVDKNRFDSVLNNLKGIGDVYNWNITGQDVTDQYIDVDSRLRLLKLEEEKLVSYIDKLTDLDEIFKMESQLTDIRQQIERLTVNLKKMSDLVELSTINVNMNEKRPGKVEPVKEKSYGDRLLDNLTDSLKGVVNFCGELLIILISALPILILLGIIVFIVIFIYRRIPKKVYASPIGQNLARPVPEQQDLGLRSPDVQVPDSKKDGET